MPQAGPARQAPPSKVTRAVHVCTRSFTAVASVHDSLRRSNQSKPREAEPLAQGHTAGPAGAQTPGKTPLPTLWHCPQDFRGSLLLWGQAAPRFLKGRGFGMTPCPCPSKSAVSVHPARVRQWKDWPGQSQLGILGG